LFYDSSAIGLVDIHTQVVVPEEDQFAARFPKVTHIGEAKAPVA